MEFLQDRVPGQLTQLQVAVDCRLWHRGGVGRYIRNLVNALVARYHGDEFLLILPDARTAGTLSSLANVTTAVDDSPMYGLREHRAIPRLLKRGDFDVFHAPFHFAPVSSAIPLVVTIHDVMRLENPEWSFGAKEFIAKHGVARFIELAAASVLFAGRSLASGTNRMQLLSSYLALGKGTLGRIGRIPVHHVHQMTGILHAARAADRIIAPSRASANAIKAVCGVPEWKLAVVPHALDEGLRDLNREVAHPQPTGVETEDATPFILNVGTWRKHKNIGALLDVIERLPALTNTDVQLVLVAKVDEEADQHLLGRIAEINSQAPRVIVLHDVSDRHLASLYRRAAALVSLSKYEGFGFPVLEAMAFGCPVVAAARGAIPEIARDWCHLVDPTDVDTTCRVLRDLVGQSPTERQLGPSPSIVHRTWRDVADETRNVYKSAISGS